MPSQCYYLLMQVTNPEPTEIEFNTSNTESLLKAKPYTRPWGYKTKCFHNTCIPAFICIAWKKKTKLIIDKYTSGYSWVVK